MDNNDKMIANETEETGAVNDAGPSETSGKKSRIYWLILGLFIGIGVSQLFVFVMLKIQGVDKLYLLNAHMPGKKSTSVLTKDATNKIHLIEDSIESNYLMEVDDDELENGLYEGLVEATGDRYADYYTREDMKKLKESTTGVFYGIGAYVGIDTATNYPKLTGIIEDTPAERAGLLAEDVIIEVDGQNVRGMDLNDVVALIKGDIGTSVTLTIYRSGETEYRDIPVTRDKVESPTVKYELMDDGIAYIRIYQFESVTSDQFAQKLEQARNDNMKGLIIDLRNNPGGTLESVVKIARQLLPKGMIVYTEDKYGKRNEFKCDGKNEFDLPLVVLINEGSASASEILSGAVKDYGIGKLVGKTTFGKGIVQKIFYLSDGTALKLTISHYYTPKGNDIHEVGIKPDVDVDLDPDKYLDDDIDTQLEKAKEELLKLMHG